MDIKPLYLPLNNYTIMPKQTVEEAAQAFANGHYGNINTLRRGFLAGSAWQKQQGIEWLRCDMELPPSVHRTAFGADSNYVLVTEGNVFEKSYYTYEENGEGLGWYRLPFTPTHWALINLPKTDE